jgi:hypothetical protein
MKRKLLLGAVFSTLALNAIAQPLLQCGATQAEPAAVIKPALVEGGSCKVLDQPLFAKDGLGSSYSDSSEREARNSSQALAPV